MGTERPPYRSIRRALAVALSLMASVQVALGLDPNDRVAVRDAYNAALVDGRAAGPQWSGDPDRCAAGSEAEASRGATVEAINFIRAMNHLAPVGLDAAAGDRARAAALIMRANNGLSHTPPRTWRCWSDAGASAAANGNLSLGPRNGVDHILAYLRDPGPGNGAVGHRRWLLYPPLAGVGTATTDTTNVLVVVGTALQARPAVPVVSWPPAGQVPWPLVFERFSISSPEHPQADFSRAELSVSANGVALPVTPEPVVDGYGDNTLVARVAIPDDLRAAGADTAFEVTARNVVDRVDGVGGGNGATSLTFTVRFTAFTDTSTWDPASVADGGSAEVTVEPAAPLAGGTGPGRIAGSAAPSGTRSPATRSADTRPGAAPGATVGTGGRLVACPRGAGVRVRFLSRAHGVVRYRAARGQRLVGAAARHPRPALRRLMASARGRAGLPRIEYATARTVVASRLPWYAHRIGPRRVAVALRAGAGDARDARVALPMPARPGARLRVIVPPGTLRALNPRCPRAATVAAAGRTVSLSVPPVRR